MKSIRLHRKESVTIEDLQGEPMFIESSRFISII